MKSKFWILILLVVLKCEEIPYQRIINDMDPEAKCLDGSPPYMFIHEGQQKDKFLIWFNGGGACSGTSLEEIGQICLPRAFSFLGSSLFTTPTTLLSNQGYLSTDPKKNKFAGWTKVIFGYCDGFFFQGNRKEPIQVENQKLYFRGGPITRSNFAWLLKQKNFAKASNVVLTGASAGGRAVALWANYVQQLLENQSVLSLVIDSAAILAFSPFGQVQEGPIPNQITYDIINQLEKTPSQLCNQVLPGQQWLCLDLEFSYCALSAPAMLIESQYDTYGLQNFLLLDCVKNGTIADTMTDCSKEEVEYAQRYRQYTKNFLKRFLTFPKNSVWAISCIMHTHADQDKYYDQDYYKVPQDTGLTIRQAVQMFVFEKKRVVAIDTVSWPNNKPCAF